MTGICYLWSETGTEGGWWVMQEDGATGYDGMHILEEGDEFTVFADDGGMLWHGIIHQDATTGLVPRQVLGGGELVDDPGWKQQVVGGYWVHWTQAGIDPEVWDQLFEGDKRCRLIKPDTSISRATPRRRQGR